MHDDGTGLYGGERQVANIIIGASKINKFAARFWILAWVFKTILVIKSCS